MLRAEAAKSQIQQTARFEEHYRENVRALPGEVNMTGVYVTLISGLIEIFGWSMLLEACATDQAAFGELANRYDVACAALCESMEQRKARHHPA
ncbi:MAG: hypothetical protein EOM58_08615, partial [Clostridia bacterium]|nr:hypothetical protein [Clostridia bacterium]